MTEIPIKIETGSRLFYQFDAVLGHLAKDFGNFKYYAPNSVFDSLPESYLALSSLFKWNNNALERVIRGNEAFKIADFACGTGNAALHFTKKLLERRVPNQVQLYLYDYKMPMLAPEIEANLARWQLQTGDEFTLDMLKRDFEALPLIGKPFNLGIMANIHPFFPRKVDFYQALYNRMCECEYLFVSPGRNAPHDRSGYILHLQNNNVEYYRLI